MRCAELSLTDSSLIAGIIYSDIGTSPLYVINGIWPPGGPVPSEEDVIGGVSAIVWSLTLLPLLKYVRFPTYFQVSRFISLLQVVICLRFGTSEGMLMFVTLVGHCGINTSGLFIVGEGGTFALFHGLYPPKTHDIDSDRTLTGETVVSGKGLKESSIMEKIRWPMLICVGPLAATRVGWANSLPLGIIWHQFDYG